MSQLTHLDETGAARMVDVGDKAVTQREATARGCITMQATTLTLIEQAGHKKGDVLAIARIAGIQAAKKCSDLIPLCHTLMLNSVDVSFRIDRAGNAVHIESCCRGSGKTGVDMEALTAVSVAALTIYDMCKAVDRGMEIQAIGLLQKSGGNSGDWRRQEEPPC
jgi:cyclic pyranopterin phosphate synthase